MTTGVVGAVYVFPAGSPLTTLTMMLANVFPGPSTRTSEGCGVACFLAQAASADMFIAGRFGTLPSKVTVPVIVAAAKADPPSRAAANIAKVAVRQRLPDMRISLSIAPKP